MDTASHAVLSAHVETGVTAETWVLSLALDAHKANGLTWWQVRFRRSTIETHDGWVADGAGGVPFLADVAFAPAAPRRRSGEGGRLPGAELGGQARLRSLTWLDRNPGRVRNDPRP